MSFITGDFALKTSDLWIDENSPISIKIDYNGSL